MKRITVSVAASAALALLTVPVFMKWTSASAAQPPTGQETSVSTGATSADVVDVFAAGADNEVNAEPAPSATWTEQHPTTSPSARLNHAMAYDSALGRVVLYGGGNGYGTPYDDTWAWNGKTWTNISSGVRPPARQAPAMAYDAARSRAVLFGGGAFTDTWELDGTTWTQMFPVTSPPRRSSPAMAYDAARGVVVMFSGTSSLADTWEWDGITWTELAPTTSPPGRSFAKMAYDEARGRIVLFGGRVYGLGCTDPRGYCQLSDTWEWDGSDWTALHPATSPPARATTTLAYDSARERVVLFGGGSNEYGYLGDTWEWDGSTWSQIEPDSSPPARGYTSMAYDAARGRTVLFGGCCPELGVHGDTWEYGVADALPPVPVYLPLAFRNSTLTDRSTPVPLPDPCDYLVAGPPASGRPSVIDLSAAHNNIRFFGVAERYSTVDQALLKAFSQSAGADWPVDGAEQRKFLETYASDLQGVCALPAAAGELGPARVELVDGTIALVHPGTGPVVLPDESTAVAIDLRGLPNVPELGAALEAAVAPALARPVLRPLSSARRHSGLADEVASANNVYNNSVTASETSPITPTGRADLPLLVLTEQKLAPAAAELAATMRLADRAVLVGDDVRASVAESRWSAVGANGFAWRAMDLIYVGAAEPPIIFPGLEVHQDDCNDYYSASAKRDFSTDRSTANVTVHLTGTIGTGPGTYLAMNVLYDRDGDGAFVAPGEVVAMDSNPGPDKWNTKAIVSELLPPGHFQVWVYGCEVPNEPVMADLSIVVQDGHRWPDVVPADLPTDDPLRSLGAAMALWPGLPDIEDVPATRATIRQVESFGDVQPIGVGPAEQHAALVVLHGAYRRFYPYFDVVGDGIDDRLLETLSAVPADGQYTRKSLVYSLRRMAEVTRDGHSFTNGSSWPRFSLPAQLESVGGEAVVRRAAFEGINPGDTIVSFNGRPTADVYAEEYERTSAATDGYRFDLASQYITQLEGPTTLELRAPDGLTHTVVVTNTGTIAALGPIYPRKSGWLTDLDAPDLYYLNLDGAITPGLGFRTALAEAMPATGLVVDMRGYPGGVPQGEVARRLIGTTFQAPVFRWKVFDGPDNVSQFDYQGALTPLQDPHYDGPIVLLVGPHTVSAAENFSLMLVGAHRVTVVGQRSAGTNGNITGVQLPGGVGVTFTGMEVLYPDRSVFHGVGIVPDVEAAPSAADLRDGIDRELVTAVDFLKRP